MLSNHVNCQVIFWSASGFEIRISPVASDVPHSDSKYLQGDCSLSSRGRWATLRKEICCSYRNAEQLIAWCMLRLLQLLKLHDFYYTLASQNRMARSQQEQCHFCQDWSGLLWYINSWSSLSVLPSMSSDHHPRIIDSNKDFFWSLIYQQLNAEILILHCVSFMIIH